MTTFRSNDYKIRLYDAKYGASFIHMIWFILYCFIILCSLYTVEVEPQNSWGLRALRMTIHQLLLFK